MEIPSSKIQIPNNSKILNSNIESRNKFNDELNPEQLRVVLEADGPCLVLAGAGSGKTRVITYRVAHLLQKGINPASILLLTFTNKAANEMLSRVSMLAGKKSTGLVGGTFHSVAHRILRANGAALGYGSNFSVLDQEDSRDMLKLGMKDIGFEHKERRAPSPGVLQGIISFSRNSRLSIGEVIDAKYPQFYPYSSQIEDLARAYAKRKKQSNTLDFDDLLSKLLALLREQAEVREHLAGKFQYILVDEYQDTNAIQADIVDALASRHRNLLVVGDDAQSIYSFRAATVTNILDFPRRYPDTKIFRLETNYRSSPEILDVANSIITNNTNQFFKELKAVRKTGEKPTLVPTSSATDEAEFVAERILELREDGVELKDTAVLFRATHHSQVLEMELMKRDIPYEYRGGLKFFERSHIKDSLAYLRIFANPADEVSWMRVLTAATGIGPATASAIISKVSRIATIDELQEVNLNDVLGIKAEIGWKETKSIFSSLIKAGKKEPAVLIRALIKSNYKDYLEAEHPNFEERLEDLEQMAVFAGNAADLDQFLGEVGLYDNFGALRSETGRADNERIVLSTIHQAKGLEWDTVFLIHLTDANFPNRRALSEEGGLEEERRLFYVAVTRAKRNLYLTYPASSGFDSLAMQTPSMFLEEIDHRLLTRHEIESKYGERIIELDDWGEEKKPTPKSYLKDMDEL